MGSESATKDKKAKADEELDESRKSDGGEDRDSDAGDDDQHDADETDRAKGSDRAKASDRDDDDGDDDGDDGDEKDDEDEEDDDQDDEDEDEDEDDSDDQDDGDDQDDEEDDDDDEEKSAKPASKPAPGATAKSAVTSAGKGDPKTAKPADAKQPFSAKPAADKPAAAGAATKPSPAASKQPPVPGAKPTKPVKGKPAGPKRGGGFSMRNVILFGALVVVLLAAFGVLGNRDGGGLPNIRGWKAGDTPNVEITVVTTDWNNLACMMEGDIKGRHCGFTAPNKATDGAKNAREDDKLLQPFSTTDHANFLASGFFMQPELKEKLDKENWDTPSPRFNVTCKLVVEGRAKAAKVQWKQGDGWGPGDNWPVGEVKECKIAK